VARRPIATKRALRLRKAFRRSPASYIDLVTYLMDRRYADTKGKARQMLLDGKVRVGSHKVGRVEAGNDRTILSPYLPADQQSQILVVLK
jgi:hypothetical protein